MGQQMLAFEKEFKEIFRFKDSELRVSPQIAVSAQNFIIKFWELMSLSTAVRRQNFEKIMQIKLDYLTEQETAAFVQAAYSMSFISLLNIRDTSAAYMGMKLGETIPELKFV